jgi:hypothetical protein
LPAASGQREASLLVIGYWLLGKPFLFSSSCTSPASLAPITAPSGAITDAADVYYRRVSADDRRRRRLLPPPQAFSSSVIMAVFEPDDMDPSSFIRHLSASIGLAPITTKGGRDG